MSRPSPWTPERLAMLRAEWAGDASTAEIGRRMGISKNAVIGKARRMKLPAREAPAIIVKQTRPRQTSARPSAGRDAFSFPGQSRPVTISGVVPFAVERRASSLPVENLPEAVAETPPPRVFLGTQCCHPMGDRTCNEPVQANARGLKSSYCPQHFAIIHAAPPAKSANNPPPAGWLKNRLAMRARG